MHIVLRFSAQITSVYHRRRKTVIVVIIVIVQFFLHSIDRVDIFQLLHHHSLLLAESQHAILADLKLTRTVCREQISNLALKELIIDVSGCSVVISWEVFDGFTAHRLIDILHVEVLGRVLV